MADIIRLIVEMSGVCRVKRRSMKLMSILVVAVFVAISAVSGAVAGEPLKIKVMVLSMFEVGENTGDFAGEFQHWYEGYLSDSVSFDVKGAPNPVYVSESGMAGTVVGVGKVRAASTLTAILLDRRFDFSETYFLTSGCAGAAPDRSTLGSVVWCYGVVDYELGYSWEQSDGMEGEPTFMAMDDFSEDGNISLNRELADRAFELSRKVKLRDDPKADEYRDLYSEEAAKGSPSVQMGVSVTADSYWHGVGCSAVADHICDAYDAGTYMVTQMEDSAFALVLRDFGYLNRYLVLRDVVNFDRPHPGQTVKESLAASSGGFSIGMSNGFAVGSAVVNDILTNWSDWK